MRPITKQTWFSMVIFALASVIFWQSPLLSQSIKPAMQGQQYFVQARVVKVLDEQLGQDTLAPSIMVGKQSLNVRIDQGIEQGKVVRVPNQLSRQHNVLLAQGDKFILLVRQRGDHTVYWVYNHYRAPYLYAMLAVFLLALIGFGGKEGINSIVSLYFTAALIVGVLIPCTYAGWNPALIAIGLVTIKVAVNFVLVSGYNQKTLAAILGTLIGVILSGVFATLFGHFAHLSGIYLDQAEDMLYLANHPMAIYWLMFTAVIISALGAIMDVAISIASSYQELKEGNHTLTPRQLRMAAMNIGRDIMGTMTNTLVLAIAGSSLVTLMLIWGFNMPMEQFMNTPLVAMMMVHTLSGSFGIVIAIPATAWVASVLDRRG